MDTSGPSASGRHLKRDARPKARAVALAAALAVILSGCAGWDMGGGRSDGMHGDMPMGGMHGSSGRADEAPPPVEDAADARITASELAFAPAAIDLVAGETVNITVSNEGRLFHDFVLEAAGVALGLDPGEQASAALRLDDAGTYEAICTVPGHAAAGMVLTVTVRQGQLR